MPVLEYAGRLVQLSDEGFLVHPREWNEEIAALLALSSEGITELSDEHWAVIRFIRQHYLSHRFAPKVRALCLATGLRLKRVYELFPSGPAKGACKVAGLSRPDGCV
ncbi:MAG: TusE/DsrC/DsvC family sulfur relay protein [Myxococcota bacterium]|jgi:tRNA 2-thiouridine synthesizing protein E|nr:TusE/DsrC/DsvC family sulfur relay protein [Myxococcota bacterium]